MDHTGVPLVTAGAAAILALMQATLMIYAALGRAKYVVGLGDGGQDGLLRRIRMHGNLAENAPIFLILLGLVESAGYRERLVLTIAVAFVLARFAHAFGLSRSAGASKPRTLGATATAICIYLLSILLLVAIVGRSSGSYPL
jgi:uncharacterized protein